MVTKGSMRIILFLLLFGIVCGGSIVSAGDMEIEAFGDINFTLVSENYTFPIDNGPVVKNFWADVGPSTYSVDNYTWSIRPVQGGPGSFDNFTSSPQNYDNFTFTNPGVYTLTCVAENVSTTPHPTKTESCTFNATLTINGNFSYGPTGIANLVNFTYIPNATSPIPNEFEWNFGDNSANRTVANNVTTYYQYATSGNYTVVVTARKIQTDTPKTYSQYILASSNSSAITVNASPVAAFWIAGNYTKNVTPFLAEFHNNSTNATNYTWQYGDGSPSEANNSAIIYHDYLNPGRFLVNLTATSSWGSNTTSKLLIGYKNISANYTYALESCPAFPVNVTFRDNSSTGSNIDRWDWNFGDGVTVVNTTTNSVTHAFQYPQSYNVTMIGYNDTYEISNLTNQTIDVTGLYANFTRQPSEDIFIFRGDKATVVMNSTSVGTDVRTYYDWNLGNGLTDTYKNVTGQYTAGIYNVSLTISNRTCGGSNTSVQQIRVYEYLTSAFNYTPSYGSFPLTVQFQDNSTDTPDQWNWKFYDASGNVVGTNTTSSRPTFVYNQPGSYRVDLVTRNGFGHESNLYTQIVTLTTGITADFNANRTAGVAPFTVLFTDNSTPVSTISNRTWNFGDGQANSTDINPVHVFSQAGVYNVTLTAWNVSSGSSGVKQKTSYISVGSPLVANFAPNATFKVNSTLLVNFTDLSTPASQVTNWSWNFGDNQTSTQQNPIHQFPAFGIYNVSLNVSNPFYGSSNITTFPVNISEIKIPVAKFEGNPRTVTTNQTVAFADKSEGPEINKWFWDFGDGKTSNETNPSHGYEFAGSYDVTLTVTNPYGSGNTTMPDYIKVKGPVIADFIIDPSDWGVVNQPVTFIDASKGEPISWIWNFGDSNSTTTNSSVISHTYSAAGWYTITMTGTNWDGQSGTAVKQIEITNKTRPKDVDFGVVGKKYSGTHPLTVQFEDFTPNQSNVTEWYWDFGDRTNVFLTSPGAPSHTYALPGEYSVTLTVRNEAGVNEKKRVAYVVVV